MHVLKVSQINNNNNNNRHKKEKILKNLKFVKNLKILKWNIYGIEAESIESNNLRFQNKDVRFHSSTCQNKLKKARLGQLYIVKSEIYTVTLTNVTYISSRKFLNFNFFHKFQY